MTGPDRTTGRKLLWFFALWLAGVGVLGSVAFVLRSLLAMAAR